MCGVDFRWGDSRHAIDINKLSANDDGPVRQRDKGVADEIYNKLIRARTSVGASKDYRIGRSSQRQKMVDHIEDVVFENIANIDPDDLMDIVDDAFENAEVNFEELMDEESEEESVLSDDSACISDQSEDLEEHVEKVVSSAELHALNSRTKHCMILFGYSTGGALSVCATCIIELSDVELGGLNAVRIHETGPIGALNGRYCSNCRQPMCIYIPTNMCPLCVH